MIQLRTVALTVLLCGVTVFVARLVAPRSAADGPVPTLTPMLRELEVRLLEHWTDSILGSDGRTRQPVRLGFPSDRPVVALLYESTCPACQLAESGWGDMARRVGDLALPLPRVSESAVMLTYAPGAIVAAARSWNV